MKTVLGKADKGFGDSKSVFNELAGGTGGAGSRQKERAGFVSQREPVTLVRLGGLCLSSASAWGSEHGTVLVPLFLMKPHHRGLTSLEGDMSCKPYPSAWRPLLLVLWQKNVYLSVQGHCRRF